jgi:hypothetical protein
MTTAKLTFVGDRFGSTAAIRLNSSATGQYASSDRREVPF